MSNMRKIKAKFERGGKLGRRARAMLAKKIGCSDDELLRYLKKRHLIGVIFNPMQDITENIAHGVRIANATK